jgi:hypothetical protein
VTSCCNRGGSVFLIMFKTRHALLLRQRRNMVPGNSRGIAKPQPRASQNFQSFPRTIHVHGHSTFFPRTRFIHGHRLGTSTINPRLSHFHDSGTIIYLPRTQSFHAHSAVLSFPFPRIVRRHKFSTYSEQPRHSQIIFKPAPFQFPGSFHTSTNHLPAYVHN